jgi:hypothetical protein
MITPDHRNPGSIDGCEDADGRPSDAGATRPSPLVHALLALAIYAVVAGVLLQSALFGDDVVSPGAGWVRTGPFPASLREQAPAGLGVLADRVNQYVPWMLYAAEAYAVDGRLPLWKSLALCGAPLVGNGQSAHFFPTNLAAILLGAPPWVHAVQSLVKLVGGAFFAFLLARYVRLSFLGALLAGLVFGFGGFQVLYLQYTLTNGSMLLPLLLIATDRVALAPTPGRVALLALVGGLQHFGGHAETAAHCHFAAFVLGAVRVASLRPATGRARARVRRLAALCAGFGLAATLGAVQILPQLEYIAESDALANRTLLATMRAAPPLVPTLAFLASLAVAIVCLRHVAVGRRFVALAATVLAAATFLGLVAGLHAGLSPVYFAPFAADWYGTPTDYYGPVNYIAQNEAFVGGALPLALLGLIAGRPRVAVRAAGALTGFGLLALYDAPGLDELLGLVPGLGVAVNSRFALLALLGTALLAGCGLDALGRLAPSRGGAERAPRGVRARYVVLLLVLGGASYGALAWGVRDGVARLETAPRDGPADLLVHPLAVGQVLPRLPRPLVARLESELAPLNEPYAAFAGWFLAPGDVSNAHVSYGPARRVVPAVVTPAGVAGDGDEPWRTADGRTPWLFAGVVARRALVPGPSPVRLRVALRGGEALVSQVFLAPDDPDVRSLGFPARPAPGRAPQQLALLLVSAGLCVALLRVGEGLRLAAQLTLAALVVAALLPFTAGMLPLLPSGLFQPRSDALDMLRRTLLPGERIFPADAAAMTAEIPVGYGLADVRGYDAVGPRRTAMLLRRAADVPPWLAPLEVLPQRRDFDLRLLGLMSVRYVVDWDDAPADLPVVHYEGERFLPPWAPFPIVSNPHFLPRARLVANAIVEPDDGRALQTMLDPGFPLETTVVLAGGTPAVGSGAPAGTAWIVKDRPEIVRVAVHPTEPCHLLLADTHFPGWKALVDGRPREIVRADVAFRAVAVRPGDRMVEFRYEPLWYRVGGVLSALTAVALLALLATPLVGRLRVGRPGRGSASPRAQPPAGTG